MQKEWRGDLRELSPKIFNRPSRLSFFKDEVQSFTGQWVTPLNGSNQISGLKFEAIILILFGLCLDISCLL